MSERFRRRCAWCGVVLRGWQMNRCRRCAIAIRSEPRHPGTGLWCSHASRWEAEPDAWHWNDRPAPVALPEETT
jgi:hypothetical protein